MEGLLPSTWKARVQFPWMFLILQNCKTNLCSFLAKIIEKLENFKELIKNELSYFCGQYQYLHCGKLSGVEVEISVHKASAMDLLNGGGVLQDSPGSDRVNDWRLQFHRQQTVMNLYLILYGLLLSLILL